MKRQITDSTSENLTDLDLESGFNILHSILSMKNLLYLIIVIKYSNV